MDKPSRKYDLRENDCLSLMQSVDKNMKMLSVDELAMINRKNSDLISLHLENTTPAESPDKDILIPFGSPLGVIEEYTKVPLYPSIVNHALDNLNYLTDDQGINAPFWQLLNRRFLRHPVMIKQIEVIINRDLDVDKLQAAKQIGLFEIPYNSATDSTQQTGAFVAKDKDYTATYLLNKPVPFGDFVGAKYLLLSGAKVDINFYLAAIDTPTMKVL